MKDLNSARTPKGAGGFGWRRERDGHGIHYSIIRRRPDIDGEILTFNLNCSFGSGCGRKDIADGLVKMRRYLKEQAKNYPDYDRNPLMLTRTIPPPRDWCDRAADEIVAANNLTRDDIATIIRNWQPSPQAEQCLEAMNNRLVVSLHKTVDEYESPADALRAIIGWERHLAKSL